MIEPENPFDRAFATWLGIVFSLVLIFCFVITPILLIHKKLELTYINSIAWTALGLFGAVSFFYFIPKIIELLFYRLDP